MPQALEETFSLGKQNDKFGKSHQADINTADHSSSLFPTPIFLKHIPSTFQRWVLTWKKSKKKLCLEMGIYSPFHNKMRRKNKDT